ncbi:MAG TPA: PEP-CTERM-box response regulator transcription factor [Candidatus Cybelea sp.]|nr:PEP-CTERM-box response regulator transcription factor [Candidatus Cybelea sp.]
MKPKILIVEDDEEIRTQMKWGLSKTYEIFLAEDRPSAIERFQTERPLLVVLDLGLPPHPGDPEEGLAALSDLLSLERLAKIIVVTGQGEKAVALRAIGGGAWDFLCKPVDMDELKLVVKRALYVAGLDAELRQMQQVVSGHTFEGMLGSSSAIRVAFESIRKVATTDAPVLLLGESGTGKEMAARAIHMGSGRKDGPFVAINCSAIPETLLESELFGHEKGSFTGAHAQRKGRFESADKGTLFLDEIGEIPLPLQVKLLRFLQEQCIERVGGRQSIPIDARVVTATNADLRKGMLAGTFREDLFYRLAVVQIVLPPLRDREGDIRLLSQFFLQRFAQQQGKPGLTFDQDSLRALDRYHWPGNVRQLENNIRRAVIMAEGKRLTVKDLELSAVAGGAATSLKDARENLEREMIQNALRKHSGKIAPAAAELGVSRPTLYDLMEKHGMPKE